MLEGGADGADRQAVVAADHHCDRIGHGRAQFGFDFAINREGPLKDIEVPGGFGGGLRVEISEVMDLMSEMPELMMKTGKPDGCWAESAPKFGSAAIKGSAKERDLHSQRVYFRPRARSAVLSPCEFKSRGRAGDSRRL